MPTFKPDHALTPEERTYIQGKWDAWTEQLRKCKRRMKSHSGAGHLYFDDGLAPHSSDCMCSRCLDWNKAEELHNEYRRARGLPT